MAALKLSARPLLPCALALAAMAAAVPRSATVVRAAAPVPLEYAVKANYLYKFAPFVTWPADAFAPGNPFTICLIGDNGFGAELDEAVRGQAIDGRPIAIKRITTPAAVPPCHILFIGRSTQPAAVVIRAAAAYPILTVTDHDRGAGGGMIDFTLQSGRVRFAIDPYMARASGLQISSKLLSLALSVKGR